MWFFFLLIFSTLFHYYIIKFIIIVLIQFVIRFSLDGIKAKKKKKRKKMKYPAKNSGATCKVVSTHPNPYIQRDRVKFITPLKQSTRYIPKYFHITVDKLPKLNLNNN